MARRRPSSPLSQHQRWLDWRRKKVEENYPDVCTCYIDKPTAKQGSCKNCEMCPGCEQHIKNEYWAAHEKKCRALAQLENRDAIKN